ncbi:BrnA antitoxin family protein [Dankookia rubra]
MLAFHKAQGPGYLTRMNRDLRAAMLQNLQRRILPKGRQVG